MNMAVVSCSLSLSASSLLFTGQISPNFLKKKIDFELFFGVFSAQKKKGKMP
jgi:hypothetical protein